MGLREFGLVNMPSPPVQWTEEKSVAEPESAATPLAQIVCGTPAFAVGGWTTVTVTDAQEEGPQELTQWAKYVVVTVGAATVSGEPEPIVVPVQLPADQRSWVPEPPEAESVMVR